MNKVILQLLLLVLIGVQMSTSLRRQESTAIPSRVYYTTSPNGTDTRELTVTNTRSGTKVYHSFFQDHSCDIEIIDFKKSIPASEDIKTTLQLTISVTGKLWVEGHIFTELQNMGSGKKTKLSDTRLHALPGDVRRIQLSLSPGFREGFYTATALVSYGKKGQLKMAKLELAIP